MLLLTTGSAARGLRETLFRVYASPRLLHPADRVVLALAGRRPSAARAAAAPHLLVCPPGGGNVGDQAMVEAFLGATQGPVLLVVRDAADVAVPPGEQDRVDVVALRALVYGGGPPHVRDVLALARLLGRARSLSVVGADLMDGGYGHRPAANLALVAEAAGRRGVPARVLGFSWGPRPHPGALRALRRAGRHGVRLLVRDPLSATRLRDAGVDGTEQVLDTVFAASHDVDPSAADRLLDGTAGEPLVVVNASGLVGARVEQVPDHVAVVRGLRARGARVVLLPHVRRPGGDDLAQLRQVVAGLAPDPGVTLVEDLLTPAQVRGLVDRADAVLTGRMHLAVIALSRGVPAVCLATQGKVDGLMQAFGTPEHCVPPRPGMAGELLRLVEGALDARVAREGTLGPAAARARDLARLNFVGLDGPGSDRRSQGEADGLPVVDPADRLDVT